MTKKVYEIKIDENSNVSQRMSKESALVPVECVRKLHGGICSVTCPFARINPVSSELEPKFHPALELHCLHTLVVLSAHKWSSQKYRTDDDLDISDVI